MNFGEQLRILRSQARMAQGDLAQATGLSHSAIQAIESAAQAPWPSTRRALARALKLPFEDFESRTMALPSAPIGSTESPEEPATIQAAAVQTPSVAPAPLDQSRIEFANVDPIPPAVSAPGHGADLRYAPAKVMELLNRLGEVESQLRQYQLFVGEVCAACWMTDAALHLINLFGPPHTQSAGVDMRGRHISEFFEKAWGEPVSDLAPLLMHQRAADGHSTRMEMETNGVRYAIFLDPRRDSAGKVIGTVGVAIDITFRESGHAASKSLRDA